MRMGKTNAIKWTPGQLSAIQARGSTLLVSAAAGSGKTAVLTNRIIGKIIEDKCEITDFLIVTFTRAAAAEMKNKIVKALRERAAQNPADRHLRRQISRIGEAKISTIDSFCVSIIKDNFNLLGLPAKMRLMDEAESRVFLNRSVNETLEKFYAEYDGSSDNTFALVTEALSGDRDDEGFVKALTDIYKTVISFPEPEKLLERTTARLGEDIEACCRGDMGIFDTCFGKALKVELCSRLENARRCALEARELCIGDSVLEEKYLPVIDGEIELAELLVALVQKGAYDGLRGTIGAYVPERLKSAAKSESIYEKERIKTLRDAFKDILKIIKTEILVYPENSVLEQCAQSHKMCAVIAEMIRDLIVTMRQEKIRRRIMDFSDLGHFTFEALVKYGSFDLESGKFEKTPLAHKLTEEYTEIFIDEYQDTNLLQDTLFRAISTGRNLFMVGDLKQSIYRFRGADPSIFRRYKDGFEQYGESDAAEQKIFLSENFRSNGGVLDFVNLLFSKTMNILSPGSYIDEDMLICTKEEEKIIPELHLFQKSPRGEGNNEKEKEAEWEFIARSIVDYHDKGYDYSDIAVLTRDGSGLLQMKRVLDKYDIPCVTESRDSLFDKSEILMMLCILNTIDNPRRDIYLIGAMTSPFFGFDSDELYRIKQFSKGIFDGSFYGALMWYAENSSDALADKIKAFETAFVRWRELSTGIGVAALIRTVFNDISVLSVISDKARADNLLSFYDFAQSFEAKELKGLFMFISYVNDIIENGYSMNVPQESGNSVKLMTMHKSKGLEFSICFVAGLNKLMNVRDLNGSMIVSKEFGVAMKHSDMDGIVSYDTLFHKIAVLGEKNKMLEEELRLLYVAFTRAKRNLILTASVSPSEVSAAGAVTPVYDMKKAQSHFDLIAAALKYDGSYNTITERGTVFSDDLKLSVTLHSAVYAVDSRTPSLCEEEREVLNIEPEKLIFEYEKPFLASVPQKLSVSQLHLGLCDDIPEENEVYPYEAPAFIGGKAYNAAAAAGTAMHTFVQFCDYAICAKKGCAYEAERLLREQFITCEQYEMLDMKKLDRFFSSSLYEKIRSSAHVHREMRFNILVDGDKLSEKAAGEKILIQGVIDCFFENPDGTYTVVDFKTDRVNSPDILVQRHSTQLKFYAYAVSDMTGKRVKETIIYSFSLSREVHVI